MLRMAKPKCQRSSEVSSNSPLRQDLHHLEAAGLVDPAFAGTAMAADSDDPRPVTGGR